jgi:O-antigen/teichoic acid export membrane protein
MVTLWLPLVLVRLLTPEAFGGYKQFFLVVQTCLVVGQLGFTQSLYYFLPRGEDRGAYLSQAVLALGAIGVTFGLALYLGAAGLSALLASPVLQEARTPLALTVAAMLAAAPLEVALVGQQRLVGAAVAASVSDAMRAAALVLAALFLGQPTIFWAATAIAWLRVAALGTLFVRSVLPLTWPGPATWRAQVALAVPFAGAGLLSLGQRYFGQYAVSAAFDPATFAIFTTASFHLFVVDVIFNPIGDVLTVRLGALLGEGSDRRGEALREWHRAVGRLATLLLPVTGASLALGSLVIPLLFTPAYAAAVPLFLLVSLQIPLWLLPVDAVLWASGKSRYLLFAGVVRTIGLAVGIVVGIHFLGPAGALVATLAVEAGVRTMVLRKAAGLLGVPVGRMVEGPTLAWLGLAAALAGVTARLASTLPVPAPLQLAVGLVAYGLTYVGLLLGAQRRGWPVWARG